MDNITHTLTGVLLARSGLNRLSPRATWIATIAANAPDVDVVTMALGFDAYFLYHRAHTHAILFLPLVAILPVLLVAAIFRERLPWFRAWLLALAGVGSHLLLDFTNTYGIRLFLPFSESWPALNSTHVFDIWIWAILLIAVLWPMLSGLVSSEIGAQRKPGQGIAIAALTLLTLYDAGRYLLFRRAVETMDSRLYDDSRARRVVATPSSVNPWRWTGWVETDAAWLKLDVNLSREFHPDPKARHWKIGPHPAVEAAKRLQLFHVMGRFARTPLWRVTPADEPPGASKVELIDLRFGNESRQGFTVVAIVDAAGQPLRSWFEF